MKTRTVGKTPEPEVKRGPGYYHARKDAEAIDRWGAAHIALCVDKGWVAEWPFEVTFAGRYQLRGVPRPMEDDE